MCYGIENYRSIVSTHRHSLTRHSLLRSIVSRCNNCNIPRFGLRFRNIVLVSASVSDTAVDAHPYHNDKGDHTNENRDHYDERSILSPYACTWRRTGVTLPTILASAMITKHKWEIKSTLPSKSKSWFMI